MEPKIENQSAFRFVGMKYRGRNEQNEIPLLWREFASRVAEVQNRQEEHATYGIAGNYDQETGEFDYLAALHVTAAADVPEGMVSWHVPAHTYAVFSCTLPTITETHKHIRETWLPGSGYRHTGGPELELYDEAFDPENPASLTYLCIPIEEPA
jgi:AraC family transcriptional regulator